MTVMSTFYTSIIALRSALLEISALKCHLPFNFSNALFRLAICFKNKGYWRT